MVRSSSLNLWSRVSKEAAAKGLDFESLGRALMSLVKAEAPKLSAVELVFITTSKQDVKRLDPIARDVKALGSDMVKETWKARGYDLDCDLDCSSCKDRAVCDEIREVIVAKNEQKDERERVAAEA